MLVTKFIPTTPEFVTPYSAMGFSVHLCLEELRYYVKSGLSSAQSYMFWEFNTVSTDKNINDGFGVHIDSGSYTMLPQEIKIFVKLLYDYIVRTCKYSEYYLPYKTLQKLFYKNEPELTLTEHEVSTLFYIITEVTEHGSKPDFSRKNLVKHFLMHFPGYKDKMEELSNNLNILLRGMNVTE